MRAIWQLSRFLVREFFRSLLGAVPPAIVGVGLWLFFQYGFDDAPYLITVGGLVLAGASGVTTLLLADRMNRALAYPLLLRLPGRAHLLAALVLATLLTTLPLAVLFVIGALQRPHPQPLTAWEWSHLLARWPLLWLLASLIALHLSPLVSRARSHLVALGALALLPTVADQQRNLLGRGGDWLVQGANTLLFPVSTVIAPSPGVAAPIFILAYALVLGYALALAALAIWLFQRKDLLWAE